MFSSCDTGEDSLRVPWTERRSNQTILKEINPECSLGLMLKVKLQYFSHLMQRPNSLEKTMMLGKTEDRREGATEDEMAEWTPSIQRTWVWANSGRQWRTGKPGMKQSWGRRARHDRVTELIHLEADLLGYRHLYYTLAITFIVKHQQEIPEIPHCH